MGRRKLGNICMAKKVDLRKHRNSSSRLAEAKKTALSPVVNKKCPSLRKKKYDAATRAQKKLRNKK